MKIEFRAWDDKKMVSPDYVDRYGIAYWREDGILCSSKIVMQYTGLKDKKGVKIFKGDIVIPFSLENKRNKSVIIYEFNQFRIKGESLYWNWDLSQIEVIGNIYKNPELIK